MPTVATLAAADVASGVLVVAGVAKLRRPASFAAFLSTVGVQPGRRRADLLARVVGSVEIALALAAVLVGGAIWFGALGILYLALAGVSARAVAQHAPSCGCFGTASAPTSASHVVLDLLFAAGSLGASIAGAAPLVDRLDPPGSGAVYLLLVALAVVLAITTMTTASELASVRRSLAAARTSSGRTRR